MTKQIQVYSTQFANYLIVPYAIGSLVSYLKTDKRIIEQCKFNKTFVLKTHYKKYLEQARNADILLCSCYIWNWSITQKFARDLREINPGVLIIFGGPQVPEDTRSFWKTRSYIDLIVHGEGEYVLMDVFRYYLDGKKISGIPGTESDGQKNKPQERISDLSTLPSPYTSGTIRELIGDNTDDQWLGIFETTRGCPFKCTFCDWGSATYTKMRQFGEEKLLKEIDWMKDNKLYSFFIVDSNWGIYTERDTRIARKIEATTEELESKGRSLRAIVTGWAKVKLTKLIPVISTMKKSLGQGLEVAVQSLDDTVLENIQRKNANIKMENLGELTSELLRVGIRGYMELIIGLPGETVDTFKESLRKMMVERYVGGENGIYEIRAYLCQVLPNAQMNSPEYRKQFNIKTRKLVGRASVKNSNGDGVHYIESEEAVISCTSFNEVDILDMIKYYWVVRVFHLGSLTYDLCWYMVETFGISTTEFYTKLMDFLRVSKTFYGKQFQLLAEFVSSGMSGKEWWKTAYVIGENNEYDVDWTDYTFFDFTEIIKTSTRDRMLDESKSLQIKISKLAIITHLERSFDVNISTEQKENFEASVMNGCDFSDQITTPVDDFEPVDEQTGHRAMSEFLHE